MSKKGTIAKRMVVLEHGFEDCEKLSDVLKLAHKLIRTFGDAEVTLYPSDTRVTTFLHPNSTEGESVANVVHLGPKENGRKSRQITKASQPNTGVLDE